MVVTCVMVHVQQEHIDDFIKETWKNHMGSVHEPGNRRFDVLQDAVDPTRFMLYEAFDSEELAANHKKTDHYLAWREAVADWMAEPRQGIPYTVICPEEEA